MAQKPNDAVMPSLFASLKSTESMPLASREDLERLITKDSLVSSLTMAYRKRMAISKSYADELKPQCPAISASLQYDGRGRSLENVKAETRMIALDYDIHDASAEQIESMFNAACQSAYALAVYHTISGQGIRIIVGYDRAENCDLTIVELFNAMIKKAISFYNTLLNWEADQQATDIGRLCGLAHDPDAYFNWEAIPLKLTPSELKDTQERIKNEKKKNKGGRPKSSKTRKKKSGYTPSIEEAAPHIKVMIESWGRRFEEHQHNEYVTSFAYCCLKYGIEEEKALQYATSEFSQQYADTASVVRSVYKNHGELAGKWHFYTKGEDYPVQATLKLIRQWLDQNYEFVHNMVTGKYQVVSRMVKDAKYLKYTDVSDDILHSIWMEMDLKGIHTSVQKLGDIVTSDYSQPFNPLDHYLRSLPKWDGKTDYIREFAMRITVEDRPEYCHTQEEFVEYFRKWFVSMVVAWVNPHFVNQSMLILVGKGGIYKTTILGALLPPCLKAYYLNDSTSNYLDKDAMEAQASKASVNLDEFEAIFGRNLSAFKSNMTKEVFSFRRPYDKYRSELEHRASLCGTSNQQHIITDVENRRFSPWIVTKIVSPREKAINYEGLYSQAVALGQSVSKDKPREDGWVYWQTFEDVEKMRKHNRLFMVSNFAEEQILRFFRIPDESTEARFIKSVTTAEIMEKICTNPALRQNMSNQSIGSIMARLGFKSEHRRTGNFWLVVEKSGAEVAMYSNYNPNYPNP